MANDLNRCEFIGRLGRDPEVRYTSVGSAVANLSIAVSRTWKNKNTGQKEEKTTWVPLVAWGKLAEIVEKYVTKGSRIYVAGEFETRKWQDNNGNDRYTTEVRMVEMQMLDTRNTNQGSSAQAAQPQAGGGGNEPAPDFDDDIPF